MSNDAKLGLIAGLLAVIGVAAFAMPVTQRPPDPAPATPPTVPALASLNPAR